MTFYVKIDRINGNSEWYPLVHKLHEGGYKNVEYHEGGWVDNCVYSAAPHLKFEVEEDALAYVLTYGGECYREIPQAEK